MRNNGNELVKSYQRRLCVPCHSRCNLVGNLCSCRHTNMKTIYRRAVEASNTVIHHYFHATMCATNRHLCIVSGLLPAYLIQSRLRNINRSIFPHLYQRFMTLYRGARLQTSYSDRKVPLQVEAHNHKRLEGQSICQPFFIRVSQHMAVDEMDYTA